MLPENVLALLTKDSAGGEIATISPARTNPPRPQFPMALNTIKHHWGITDFRPLQPEAIEAHLAKFLLSKNKGEGLPTAKLDDSAMHALQQSDWPGNIRQLQNELTRAAAFAKGGVLTDKDFE